MTSSCPAVILLFRCRRKVAQEGLLAGLTDRVLKAAELYDVRRRFAVLVTHRVFAGVPGSGGDECFDCFAYVGCGLLIVWVGVVSCLGA